MVEGSPPYLHNRYLNADQQARCELNPTYIANLTSLRALRKDVQSLRSMVSFEEPDTRFGFARKSMIARVTDIKEIERDKLRLKELERQMIEWDDKLASLAEALTTKPKVSLQ